MSITIIRSPILGSAPIRLDASAVESKALGTQPKQGTATPTASSEVERRIRAEMERELDAKLVKLREEARKEGFDKGYQEGMTAGHADGVSAGKDMFRTHIKKLEDILAQADLALNEFWCNTTNAVENLAISAIREIIGEHALTPQVIVGMVRQLTQRLYDNDILRIRLHPAECTRLKAAVDAGDHAAKLGMGRLMDRLVSDPALEAGGCVIETPRGEYCASLDVQLTRLYERLCMTRQSKEEAQEPPAGAACA